MTKTTGWPGTCSVRSTVIRAWRESCSPVALPMSDAFTPAVQITMPAGISSPPATFRLVAVTVSTFAFSITSTPLRSSDRRAAWRREGTN